MGPLWKLLLALCLSFALTSAAHKSRPRKTSSPSKEFKEANICEFEQREREVPLHCFCDNPQIGNATDIQCVIFNKFAKDDTMWSFFLSQKFVRKVTFNVRGNAEYFTYAPVDLLREYSNLQLLKIRQARIEEIQERTFAGLSAIQEIDLSTNRIERLRKHAFENCRNLSIINLESNRIVEINRDVFGSLPSLKILHLSNNNITTLHDKSLKELSSLQDLELNNNRLSVVTRDSFHGLKNLVRLGLQGNRLAMIGENTFLEVPELQELELGQNEITFIDENALNGLQNLRKLGLSENKLTNLKANFLAGAFNVHFLDLRGNPLKTMTFDNVKPIVANLYEPISEFHLDSNKLICDCNLQWIWGLKNETKNKKLRDDLEELTCFLESNNITVKPQHLLNDAEAERKQALEIARNPTEYTAKNVKASHAGSDNYMEDDDYSNDQYDEYEESTANVKSQAQLSRMELVDGKFGYYRHLLALKVDDLPCPRREDLMASEQPSGRHGNAYVSSTGSIFSFTLSSARIFTASQAVLGVSLLVHAAANMLT